MEFNATFIVSLIRFCIFIAIMNSILYRPINNILQKRKDYIDENYNIASKNSAQKDAILEKRDNELNEAQNSAKSKIATKKEEFKKQKNQTLQSASSKAKEGLKTALNTLQNEEKKAQEEMKHQIVNLAQNICDKFITTDEKVSADDELITKILQG